tara:strand:+ start:73 stop:201 length:129 start_codon:yes stop_codon:yes gene_type:complete
VQAVQAVVIIHQLLVVLVLVVLEDGEHLLEQRLVLIVQDLLL